MEMCNTGLLFECVGKKLIGKPCEGELHARFDEGELVNVVTEVLHSLGSVG